MDWGRVGYGVDIQGGGVVLARAERGRGGRVAYATCDRDDARWRAESAAGAPLAACLGPRESVTQWLDVGFAGRAKALKVLPTVLDIRLPFALESCAYTFLALDAAKGRTRALGVAARRVDVARARERLASLALDPVQLDQEGLALWAQSLAELPVAAGDDAVRAVVYAGDERATLVVGIGVEFRGVHAVRIEDAAQMRRLLRAATGREGGIVDWRWCGPCAAAAAGGPATASLAPDWTCNAHLHTDPGAFLARGLARRLVQPDPWTCNLRLGEDAHPAAARRRAARLTRAAALALGAGLLLCAANVGVMRGVREQQAEFDRRFGALARAAAGAGIGAAQGEQALLIARRQVDALRAGVQPYAAYLNATGSRGVADVLQVAAANGLVVENLAAAPGRMSVSGRASAWESAESLVRVLEAAGMTAKLERADALADGLVPFTVSGEAVRE